MAREAFGLVLMLMLATLAGCIQPEAQKLEAAATGLTSAAPGWYAVDASAGPGGNLTAFWWTVPEGSVYKDGIWGDSDVSVLEVALESGGTTAPLTAWALFVMDKDDGKLHPDGSYVSVPYESGSVGPLAGPPDEEDATVAPFHVRLYEPKVGESFAFVLAAQSEKATPLRLLIRVLSDDPWGEDGYESPSDDVDEMLADLDGAPAPLAVVGTGHGFQVAEYLEFTGILLFPVSIYMRTAAMTVDGAVSPDLRPVAWQRQQTFSTAYDHAGWTQAFGIYWPEGGEGTWSASASTHDSEAFEAGGLVVSAPGASLGTLVTGVPFWVAMGEGAEGSASSFAIDARSTGTNGFELITHLSLSIGATMEELFGVPAASDTASAGGLVGSVARHRDAVTFTLPDGSTYTRLGMPEAP